MLCFIEFELVIRHELNGAEQRETVQIDVISNDYV